MPDLASALRSDGFAVVRGLLSREEIAEISAEADRMYQEGLRHHATFRDKNLLFEVLNDPQAKRRVVLQAHWTAWLSPLLEEELRHAGLDPSNIHTCEMEPGDLLLWTLFTVHGSAPNVSDYDRRFHGARHRT